MSYYFNPIFYTTKYAKNIVEEKAEKKAEKARANSNNKNRANSQSKGTKKGK